MNKKFLIIETIIFFICVFITYYWFNYKLVICYILWSFFINLTQQHIHVLLFAALIQKFDLTAIKRKE